MKKQIIKFLIDKAKRNKLIQSIFEQPIDLNNFTVKGSFTDRNGNKHMLYEGFRTKIRPGWEQVFQEDGKSFNQSPQRIETIAQNGKIAVERIEPIINLYSSGIKNSRILEIGCYAGGTTYAFAEKGAFEVIGSDFSGYRVQSIDSKKNEKDELKEVNENLKELRNLVRDKFSDTLKASFVDDDICNSTLKSDSFDIICSWDVLEHLHNPLQAFKNIHNLLNDNGITVHEYNPFFSLMGGHSACTIDFPWGHVILDSDDFKKFNEKIQPERFSTSVRYYLNGINRMTIKDLKRYCAEAHLDILSLLIFPKEQHVRMMNSNILEMAKNNYPTLDLNDLISTKIIVILRKSPKQNNSSR